MMFFLEVEKVTEKGRTVTLKSVQNRVGISKKSSSEHTSKLGRFFDTFGGATSFESIVNSSKIACPPASEKCSKMVPCWGRFGGQNRRWTVFLGGPKNNEKHRRLFVDFGCQNEVQNRSEIIMFLVFFWNPVWEGPRIDF